MTDRIYTLWICAIGLMGGCGAATLDDSIFGPTLILVLVSNAAIVAVADRRIRAALHEGWDTGLTKKSK